jgi:hypothetical protein
MTRRHFELLATVVRETLAVTTVAGRVGLAVDLADALAGTNDRFDRRRFIAACRPSWVVGTRHEARWDRAVAS